MELTDYAGGQPYGEYTLYADEPATSCDAYAALTLEDTRHLPAAGTQGVQQLAWTGDPNAPTYNVAQTRFLHGDMIRSTMLTTDPNASDPNLIPQSRITYTAFGEPIVCSAGGGGGGGGGDPCGTGTLAGGCQDWTIGGDLPGAPEDPNCTTFGLPPLPRYGYAGGFGYQSGRTKTRYAARYGAVAGSDPNLPGADAPYSDLLTLKGANPALPPISLQHLGHRWYDPSIGRFLQRDPIGLAGGGNLYVYSASEPASAVDPLGLDRWVIRDWNGHRSLVYGPMPNGRYRRTHFYPQRGYGLYGTGVVKTEDWPSRPKGPPTHRSTPDDDDILNDWADYYMYFPPYDYWLWRTDCIHYVDDLLDGDYSPAPLPPSLPPPNPMWFM